MIRSAQEIFRPYFCLTGQSSRRALSRFALSGQLLRGAKRCAPSPPPPLPSAMRYVPAACHAIRMESGPVLPVVSRPPLLRRRHQRDEIPPQRFKVERLELFGVVEGLTHWIGPG